MNAYDKMREALEKVLDALKHLSRTHNDDLPEDVRAVLGRMAFDADAALAAPRRNCDVGTAEEQYERYWAFCAKHNEDCTGCPCDAPARPFTYCFSKWAQMPYEEGGAK